MVPVGDARRKPAGGGGRQPADPAVGPDRVVVVAPRRQHRAGVRERGEQRLIEGFLRKRPLNDSTKPFGCGLPGAM